MPIDLGTPVSFFDFLHFGLFEWAGAGKGRLLSGGRPSRTGCATDPHMPDVSVFVLDLRTHLGAAHG